MSFFQPILFVLVFSNFSPVGKWAMDYNYEPAAVPRPNPRDRSWTLEFTKDNRFNVLNGYVTGTWKAHDNEIGLVFDSNASTRKANSLAWALTRQKHMEFSRAKDRLIWPLKDPLHAKKSIKYVYYKRFSPIN